MTKTKYLNTSIPFYHHYNCMTGIINLIIIAGNLAIMYRSNSFPMISLCHFCFNLFHTLSSLTLSNF